MQPPFEKDDAPFEFPIPDPAHFAFLKHVPPLQALHTWLDGDFRMGEEPALMHAVKTGLRLSIPDSELLEIFLEFMEMETTPQEALEALQKLRDEPPAPMAEGA